MQGKKSRIVVWCTELASVRAITDVAGKLFELVWVRDSQTFCARLAEEPAPVAALIDNAAAQNTAIGLLQSLKESRRQTRRVLLTDYCDLGIIVQGLHTEAVQKIVYKPIHGPELLSALGAQTEAMVPLPSATHRQSGARAL